MKAGPTAKFFSYSAGAWYVRTIYGGAVSARQTMFGVAANMTEGRVDAESASSVRIGVPKEILDKVA